MNKKILLALLGLALGSCGGTPASSSASPAGSSGTQSTPASDSSSAPASSDSSVTPSSSDSGQTPSSSDSGSGGGSSSSGGESSSGESSGDDSSQQDPSAAKKEKIVTFLTADDGGLNGGVVTVNTDILSPFNYGISLENILMSSRMTATYQSVGKKAASELVNGGAFLVEVGKAVTAYQEMKEKMGSNMLPVPEGVDVTTEEGAVAYIEYFLKTFYKSLMSLDVEFVYKKENGYHTLTPEGLAAVSEATYIDEKADKTDFYVYDSYEKVTRHGSAPLHTEGIHEIYRSPLGGNFMGYARTHLEKIEAAVVEDAASGVFTIKFSQLAKDPEAAEVNVFSHSSLSYVPDLTVSFDASGSISGFAGSMEQAKTKVEVRATLAKTGGSVTIPTNVVECEHSYPAVSTFEDEQGGGHYHYCLQCHSVFDYGHHEYHEGDEHCHVCDYVETVEAPLKEDVVLPEALSGLKIIESKATGNFFRVECPADISIWTENTPLDGNYRVEFESRFNDGDDSYRVLAVGTQTDGEANGCLYPMHWVVSYAKYVEDEPGTPVVIYEKTSMLEYHETQPKKIDGMGDACHVYTVEECQVCHQEYGFPQMQLDHKVEKKANQDGTYTITCSACHESAVARIGKIEDYGESHSVRYEYVSGNRELYEFFVERNSWGMHQYQDGVCVVCGHENSERQVVVDLSSYMGDGVTMTLNVNKDHETAPTAVSDEGRIVSMSARNPDNGEYISGFFIYQEEYSNYIVQCEKAETLVKDETCEYEVNWKIAVYPVTMDPEDRVYVISGPASAKFPDPWDPTLKTVHENTHYEYERQGDSCVYNLNNVCDACGETVYQEERTFHDIRVTQEGDKYRLTCEHCHENALVDGYNCYRLDENHHFWVVNGDILEASSENFRKDLMGSAFSFHFYNEEGDCLCGDHSDAHQTKFIWANHTNTGEVPDVVGGIDFIRDKEGNPTSIELFDQGKLLASDVAEPSVGHMADTWQYEALDSEGKKVGVITVTESYAPYEDGFVKNDFDYELKLDEEHGSLSSFWGYNPLPQSQPDYKSIFSLILYLFDEATTAQGKVTYEYEGEGAERHPVAIGAEDLGGFIPELTDVLEYGGGKHDVTVWTIEDAEENPLPYCLIYENRYVPGKDEEWILDAHVYYIAQYEPDNIPSSILYLAPEYIDSIAVVY